MFRRVRSLVSGQLLAMQAILGVLIFGLNGPSTPAASMVGWIAFYVIFFLLLNVLLTKIFRPDAKENGHRG